VAVLGRRARGDWSALELLQLKALLQWSLGIVFLAYLPSALALLDLEVANLWRVALGLFAIFHSFVFVWFFWRYWALPSANRAIRRFLAFAIPVGLAVLAAEFLGALGFLPQSEPFVFLVALLWFIGIAASNFVFLLLPGAEE
jgi:hypothetical protein